MNLMSFDGGGLLGCGPANFLSRLERGDNSFQRLTIADHVHAFAGTSTGSILAAALALHIPTSRVLSLYHDEGKLIFAKRPWYRRGLTGPTYDIKNLEAALGRVFGTAKFAQLDHLLVIPASDFGGQNESQGLANIYSNDITPDMEIAEAVLRSCAAPTFFAPVGNRWVDGGLFANNPTLAGVTALAMRGVAHKDMRVVSFGTTGKYWQALDPDPANPIKLAKNIINFMMAAASARVIHKYCSHLDLGYYLRLAPRDRSPEMDDLGGMEKWEQVWDAEYERSWADVFAAITA